MINSVVLVGRLTRDPELRYAGEIPTTTISIAVERPFANKNGQRDADFINVVFWRKTAETVSQYFRKGSRIGIQGRIQTRNYQDTQTGKTVYVTEVVADNFTFIDTKAENESRGISNSSNQSYSSNNNNNFQNQNAGYQNSAPNFGRDDNSFGGDSPINISDDDLPF
jgi:single-strand DNA-binding protein